MWRLPSDLDKRKDFIARLNEILNDPANTQPDLETNYTPGNRHAIELELAARLD